MALATLVDGGVEVPLASRSGRLESLLAAGCQPQNVPSLPTASSAFTSIVAQVSPANAVEAFVASTASARLWKLELPEGASWVAKGDFSAPNGTQVRGLFFTGTGRVGGGGVVGNGNVYTVSASTTLMNGMASDSVAAANSGTPAAGSGFFLWGTSGETVVRVSYMNGAYGAPSAATLAQAVSTQGTTPVLGAGRRAYVIGEAGRLFALDSASLASDWSASLGVDVSAVAQMALDVYRDGAGSKVCPPTRAPLGMLYVLTRSGATARLHAIVVDSPGLDATAPWPKYQRDNGNTGNANSDMSFWTCP
ncbi:MAG: hypothetical protein INH37_23510 [Myxococcaceae bacterium]|nr:hypothetical protein [Myxococcaceae bacterium]